MPDPEFVDIHYHANCCDGFGACFAAFTGLVERGIPEDYIECFEVTYGFDLPLADEDVAANSHLFIVDFSYSREQLIELAARYARVTLIDHHKTAIESLQDWPDKPENLELILDITRSGAMLTWNYFNPLAIDTAAPHLIQYIQDRDLWEHELGHTEAINKYIAITPKNITAYDSLDYDFKSNDLFTEMVRTGEYLLEQEHQLILEILENARPINIDGKEGLSVCCPGSLASNVGNYLALKSKTFGATYYVLANGDYKFSLRSIEDYDVSDIAKSFGGGGHRNASGFVTNGIEDTGNVIYVTEVNKLLEI